MKKFFKTLGIILLVLVLIVAVGFVYLFNNGMSGISIITEPKEDQIRVACVGDSITYGHGVKNWYNNNYPTVLQDLLGDKYHVANFGVSGSTLSPNGDQPYIERDQYQQSLDYKPDILVLMLGTNDSKPENWTNEAQFLSHLDSLINSYVEVNPDVKIYLCTPAAAFFPEGQTEGITNYDIQPLVVEKIANYVKGYAFLNLLKIENIVDIYDLTANHPEWFEADNVHPSVDGAKAIAVEVYTKITK